MRINNVDNISFGTRPLIGDIAARNALPKYSSKLSQGLLNAFEQLSKNGVNDEFVVNIGQKRGAKNPSVETIQISLFQQREAAKDSEYTSSKALNPKTLEKLSTKQITQLFLNAYEKLKQSSYKTKTGVCYYSRPSGLKIKEGHMEKIKTLIEKFGFDDWTCA